MLHSRWLGECRRGVTASVVWLLGAAILGSCADSDSDRKRLHGGANRAPAAMLRVGEQRRVGAELNLDGRLSSDPDGDVLSAVWSLEAKPIASDLDRSSVLESRPLVAAVVPDKPGTYRVRLRVSDGELEATAVAQVLIRATQPDDEDEEGETIVSLVCPSRGSLRGGERIRLTGGFFPPGTRVLFGERPAADIRILEDGSVIEVVTPPSNASGSVDIVVEAGDQVVILRGAFRYVAGPLAFASAEARDAALERPPAALLSLGEGRILLGLPSGSLQVASFRAGELASLGTALRTGAEGRVVRLRPGPRSASGALEAGGVTAGGLSALVARLDASGQLSASLLPFTGEAIDIALADIGAAGGPRVFVADRSGQRVVAYARTGDGAFEAVGEVGIAGSPCVIVPGQIDADPELEMVVGCYPGPHLSVIDETDGALAATHHELSDLAGIVLLAPADFEGVQRDLLAAVVLDGGAADPETGPRSLRLIVPRPGAEGGFLVPSRPRFVLRGGGDGLEPADLDADGDIDLVAFEGRSGDALVLENTRLDGPETPEQCTAILETGNMSAATAFDLRLIRVPMYTSGGILALTPADLDGDGLPDLAGSHAREAIGLRSVPNSTGR